jgi:hypothetical protein
LSRNKAALLRRGQPANRVESSTPEAEIKDPFVLEFLGLKDEYSENVLEEALLRDGLAQKNLHAGDAGQGCGDGKRSEVNCFAAAGAGVRHCTPAIFGPHAKTLPSIRGMLPPKFVPFSSIRRAHAAESAARFWKFARAQQNQGRQRFEMGATLTGVRPFRARSYVAVENLGVPVPSGEFLLVVRMSKQA